jgi:glycosyltransferase involved in cell wall biosynthesis
VSALKLRLAARRADGVPVFHSHTAHAAALATLASLGGRIPTIAHRRVDFRLSGRLSAKLKYGAATMVLSVSRCIAFLLARDGVLDLKIRVVPDSLPASAEEAKICGLAAPLGPAPAAARAELRARLGKRWNAAASAQWIGNLAALVGHKDQANLLKAFALVRKEIPDALCFVIGEGPLLASLKTLAKSLGVAEAVRFTGRQDNPGEWMQALDVYVQSSSGEGMGSVLLEAFACRTPIAATSAGGIPEVIDDGKSGLLCPPKNAEALAKNVLRILREPGLGSKLAEEGARKLAEFSVGRSGEKTVQAYTLAAGYRGAVPRETQAAAT